MLDQNTDRMWYVIGALVVGAGIILLANKAMPEIFANVTDSFNESSSNATALIDDFSYVGENMINFESLSYARYLNNNTGDVLDHINGQYHVLTDYIPVTPGRAYVTLSKTGIHHLRYVFYTSEKEYIAGSYYNYRPYSVAENAPDGAAYLRMSVGVESMDDRDLKIESDIHSLRMYERSE